MQQLWHEKYKIEINDVRIQKLLLPTEVIPKKHLYFILLGHLSHLASLRATTKANYRIVRKYDNTLYKTQYKKQHGNPNSIDIKVTDYKQAVSQTIIQNKQLIASSRTQKKKQDLQFTKRQSQSIFLNLLSNHITYHISRNNPETKTIRRTNNQRKNTRNTLLKLKKKCHWLRHLSFDLEALALGDFNHIQNCLPPLPLPSAPISYLEIKNLVISLLTKTRKVFWVKMGRRLYSHQLTATYKIAYQMIFKETARDLLLQHSFRFF